MLHGGDEGIDCVLASGSIGFLRLRRRGRCWANLAVCDKRLGLIGGERGKVGLGQVCRPGGGNRVIECDLSMMWRGWRTGGNVIRVLIGAERGV